MNPWKCRWIAGMLAAAVACSSVGCAGSQEMTAPTRETFTTYLRDGDTVEVVLKSGEKRKVVVAGMNEGAVRDGASCGAVPYADMASVRVVARVRGDDDGAAGTTHEWRRAMATVEAVADGCVIAAGCVAWLALQAAGSGHYGIGHW